MKKGLMVLCLCMMLITSTTAEATANNLYEYIKKIDNLYYAVVGLHGEAGDSFAATDLILGLNWELGVDIEPAVEHQISPNVNKILLGHPCGNSLIKLSCEEWPYTKGEAIITIIDNDLIIAGSTSQDTRDAVDLVLQFKTYPQFKLYKSIVMSKSEIEGGPPVVQYAKKPTEFVCGDGVCEKGEKYICLTDCEHQSCFTICKDKRLGEARCKDPPAVSNLPLCNDNEENQGFGYCAEGKVCCCTLQEELSEDIIKQKTPTQESPQEEKIGFFRILWNWLKEIFSVIF